MESSATASVKAQRTLRPTLRISGGASNAVAALHRPAATTVGFFAGLLLAATVEKPSRNPLANPKPAVDRH